MATKVVSESHLTGDDYAVVLDQSDLDKAVTRMEKLIASSIRDERTRQCRLIESVEQKLAKVDETLSARMDGLRAALIGELEQGDWRSLLIQSMKAATDEFDTHWRQRLSELEDLDHRAREQLTECTRHRQILIREGEAVAQAIQVQCERHLQELAHTLTAQGDALGERMQTLQALTSQSEAVEAHRRQRIAESAELNRLLQEQLAEMAAHRQALRSEADAVAQAIHEQCQRHQEEFAFALARHAGALEDRLQALQAAYRQLAASKPPGAGHQPSEPVREATPSQNQGCQQPTEGWGRSLVRRLGRFLTRT